MTGTARARARRGRRRGTALIEALIASSTMIVMFACIGFVHYLAKADLEALDEARFQAFDTAMRGCQEQGFDLQTALSDLAHGDLPIPDSFLPSSLADGANARDVPGLLGGSSRHLSHRVRIPCRSKPAQGGGEVAGDWLLGLFH